MQNHLRNPFRGGMQGTWYHVVLSIDEYGIVQFLANNNTFFLNIPCLMGKHYKIKQRCNVCNKDIDEEILVFVVHRIRKSIEWHFVSKIAIQLDEEDIMCSKEKYPKFLEWQLLEHQKTCGKTDPITT